MQTMSGIGASGAWWPIDLYKFPESVREQVAELLFNGTSGIGLTSYRYNVGGGGVGVNNPSRAPETFFVSPGVYNWSADPQGVYFLQKASSYGVPVLTAFVNSAPPAFTSDDASCGGTIVNSEITAYATYLADVIAHFKSEGIKITHVSPMNEPDSGFGTPPSCGQEGMAVTPSQRAAVVQALRSALNSAGLQAVSIISDESNNLSSFISESPTWLPSAASSIGSICHHNYGFASNAQAAQMGAQARNLSGGKSTWFTEICCYAAANSADAGDPTTQLTYTEGFDPTIISALQLGQLLYQAFTQTLDVHFDWWTALSNALGCTPTSSSSCATTKNSNGWNDGLIYYDPNAVSNGNYNLYTVKRFFLVKHFATIIKPGSVLHLVSGLPSSVEGLAFSLNGHTSLILMNMGSSSQSVSLSGAGSFTAAHQTTASVDWGTISISSSLTLPGYSITSLS